MTTIWRHLKEEGVRLFYKWTMRDRIYDPKVLEPFSNSSWTLDLGMLQSNSIPFTNEVMQTTTTDFTILLRFDQLSLNSME